MQPLLDALSNDHPSGERALNDRIDLALATIASRLALYDRRARQLEHHALDQALMAFLAPLGLRHREGRF